MTKETLVFIFGILLTIVPFLGIPENWRQYATLAIGVILIIIGYILRRALYLSKLDQGDGVRGGDTFVETTDVLFEDGALK